MQKALTEALVRTIPAPSSGRLDISDLRCVGLSFRVSAAGARSWNFRFRDPLSGNTSRATIGAYPTVTLSEARRRADAMRQQVAGGENPINAKRRERKLAGERTFGALADRYVNEHARRHKRSAATDERNLNLHILPKWRVRRFDDLTRADLVELIEALIGEGKQTLANRVHSLCSKIGSFAVDAGLLNGNPFAAIAKRGVEVIGRRVLTNHEIRLFWHAIIQKPVSRAVGLALRLQLLTGTRPGEAAGAARAELADGIWTISADRIKNGRSHLVPLSSLASDTIKSALDLAGDKADFLFPSPSVGNAAISAHALAVAMRRFAGNLDPHAGKSWQANPPTPHDLRRTFATRLAALAYRRKTATPA
jgi:integrase